MKKLLIILLLFIPSSIKALDVSASSYILMDMDSGRVLIGENIHKIRSVASISKIMTALLAVEDDKLNEKITIGSEINSAYGSAIYIKEGEILTLKELLYGLMLRSGNDASLSIAKNVGGSVENFVNLMNKRAEKLGMTNTIFSNPNGLDETDGNYSTAYDMAILTSVAMKNKIYREIVKTKKHILKTNMNTYSWDNKNKLLRIYKYSTGGKTGYTIKAKRTLVNTASRNNMNLVVVTLNDGNDFSDHIDLFEYAFSKYNKYQIVKKGDIEIIDSYYKNYTYYVKNNFDYLLDKTEKDNIIIKFVIEKKRDIKSDMEIGKLQVYLADEIIHEEKIYIKKEKEKISLFDKIKSWFRL